MPDYDTRSHLAVYSGSQNDCPPFVIPTIRRDLSVAAGPLGRRSNARSLDCGLGMTKKSGGVSTRTSLCKPL
jgi:hypothetical protein